MFCCRNMDVHYHYGSGRIVCRGCGFDWTVARNRLNNHETEGNNMNEFDERNFDEHCNHLDPHERFRRDLGDLLSENKIGFIKVIRDSSGTTLRDAKDLADQIQDELALTPGDSRHLKDALGAYAKMSEKAKQRFLSNIQG